MIALKRLPLLRYFSAGAWNSIPPRRILLAAAIPILIISFILYLPVIPKGFNPGPGHDDQLTLQAVKPFGLTRGWIYFHPRFWPEHRSREWVYYRPIELLSFGTDYTLWQLRPPISRCVNILLHCLNVLLFAALLFNLLALSPSSRARALPVTAMAASLFCFLPISAEPVSWIAARGELLCAAFSLVCMLALITWARTGKARWAALSILATLLALGTKETAIALPPLAAAAVLFLRQRPLRSRLALAALLIGCLAAYALFRHYTGTIVPSPHFTWNPHRGLRRFGYHISRPLTTVLEAIELRSIRRLDIPGLAQTAAILILLAQCPVAAAASLAWKAAFHLPFFAVMTIEARHLYVSHMGTTALIAISCLQGYLFLRPSGTLPALSVYPERSRGGVEGSLPALSLSNGSKGRHTPHLAPAPLIIWACILALYIRQLSINITVWAGMLLHKW